MKVTHKFIFQEYTNKKGVETYKYIISRIEEYLKAQGYQRYSNLIEEYELPNRSKRVFVANISAYV